MLLKSDVFMENPIVNSAAIGLSWRDCEIYVIKNNTM